MRIRKLPFFTTQALEQQLGGLLFRRATRPASITAAGAQLVQDLMKQSIDLSIRIGWLQDSRLKAPYLGDFEQWLLAAHGNLANVAKAQHPYDLKPMNVIAFTLLSSFTLKL